MHPSTLVEVISEVVAGKHAAVELTVTCLLAEGQLLTEDVPGTGKTTDQRTGEFKFHEGPVFANVVIADEIGRSPGTSTP
jgi:MoxR-like ATPase